jgi:ribonuclease P protein component
LPSRSCRFRRFERLKEREGIRKVFSRGRFYNCPGAKLFVLKNGLPYNRIGFTQTRKYGNAPERNRARRLGREAYRLLRPCLKTGFDLVLLVYPGQANPARSGIAKSRVRPSRGSLDARLTQLKSLFGKAGLLPNGTE